MERLATISERVDDNGIASSSSSSNVVEKKSGSTAAKEEWNSLTAVERRPPAVSVVTVGAASGGANPVDSQSAGSRTPTSSGDGEQPNTPLTTRPQSRSLGRPATATSFSLVDEFALETTDGADCFPWISIKWRIILICAVELLILSYQLTTTIIIYTKKDNALWIWYSQTFLAYGWLLHRHLVFGINLAVILASIVAVVLALHALDSNDSRFLIPHMVMQVVCITLLAGMALFFVIFLAPLRGRFAINVVDITASTMTNGAAGVGKVLYGYNEFEVRRAERRLVRQKQIQQLLAALTAQDDGDSSVLEPSEQRSTLIKNNSSVTNSHNASSASTATTAAEARERRTRRLPTEADYAKVLMTVGESAPVRRNWDEFTPGLSALMCFCVFVTVIAFELFFVVVVLQAYFYLKELRKIADQRNFVSEF